MSVNYICDCCGHAAPASTTGITFDCYQKPENPAYAKGRVIVVSAMCEVDNEHICPQCLLDGLKQALEARKIRPNQE